VKREADPAHIPSRAQRGMALAAAVSIGSATCLLLSGLTTAISTLVFTNLSYGR
jgi:hypothetical protein